ncbi:hypothetical protein L228DRAFT_26818 [Xylona heveae TC161]|uniref:Uncharacterized protein n=1 Tax=Xylona heveae (strain CBS 132557 / TC161) TaxID=1328760 RepID=A0A165AF58_XYLHT|nr:hypothetical protein L228DRAFT_26818 [Xylona heveae TC161]KZF20375.1 hypothetical protein L228DRAFT_26818 [Xylona heveae TC161]
MFSYVSYSRSSPSFYPLPLSRFPLLASPIFLHNTNLPNGMLHFFLGISFITVMRMKSIILVCSEVYADRVYRHDMVVMRIAFYHHS